MKKLLIGLTLLLTACMPYTRADLATENACPYPSGVVERFSKPYIGNVYEVDNFFMSLYCAGGQPIALLGCTLPPYDTEEFYTIYILATATRAEKKLIYGHEACHVYELAVLQLPELDSATHKNWIKED